MRILTYLFGTRPDIESDEDKALKVKEAKALLIRTSLMLNQDEQDIWEMLRPVLKDDLPYTYAELVEYV